MPVRGSTAGPAGSIGLYSRRYGSTSVFRQATEKRLSEGAGGGAVAARARASRAEAAWTPIG
jgi:hypothetical protein